MSADLRDLLDATAPRPSTAVDPAAIRVRSRRRRRVRYLGGGSGLVALALIVAVAWPGALPGGLTIDDVADRPAEDDVPTLDLPDGWEQVQVGDAVFGIPERLEIVELTAEDQPPCTNTGPRAYLARTEYPSHVPGAAPEGATPDEALVCNLAGNPAPVLFAAPLSVIPDERLQAGPSDARWESTSAGAGSLDGERLVFDARPSFGEQETGEDDGIADRRTRYRFPSVDLFVEFTTRPDDTGLIEDVLATVTQIGVPAEAPPEDPPPSAAETPSPVSCSYRDPGTAPAEPGGRPAAVVEPTGVTGQEPLDALDLRLAVNATEVPAGCEITGWLLVENRSGAAVTEEACELGLGRAAILPVDEPDGELWITPIAGCVGPREIPAGTSVEHGAFAFSAATAFGELLAPGEHVLALELDRWSGRFELPVTVLPEDTSIGTADPEAPAAPGEPDGPDDSAGPDTGDLAPSGAGALGTVRSWFVVDGHGPAGALLPTVGHDDGGRAALIVTVDDGELAGLLDETDAATTELRVSDACGYVQFPVAIDRDTIRITGDVDRTTPSCDGDDLRQGDTFLAAMGDVDRIERPDGADGPLVLVGPESRIELVPPRAIRSIEAVDDRTLEVDASVCEQTLHVEVEWGPDAITVTAYADPPRDSDLLCRITETVELGDPLGDRTVIDGATGEAVAPTG